MALDPTISLAVQVPKFDSPLEQAGKFLALRDMMSQNALRQQQVLQSQALTADYQTQAEGRRRDLADQTTLDKISTDPSFLKSYASGNPADLDNYLSGQGLQFNTIAKVKESSQKMQEGVQKLNAERLNSATTKLGDILKGVTAAFGDKPDSAADQNVADQLREGIRNLLITYPEYANQLRGADAINGGNVRDIAKNLGVANGVWGAVADAQVKRQQELQTTATSAATENKENAALPGVIADSELKTRQLAAMKAMTPEQWTAQIDAAVPVGPKGEHKDLNARTRALVTSALAFGNFTGAQAAIKDASDQIGRTETAVASAQATQPVRVQTTLLTNAAKTNADMTEDDWKREGEQFAITGVMPAMGMGSSGRAKILHYKDQFARDNSLSPRDLAVMKASFAGDTESLKSMQKNRDMMVQAETTAGLNLDNFLSLSSKIIDTGSPWINKPLRELDRELLGSQEQAAVDAAGQVATTEIAKVLSQVSGNGSGVLSDSARGEVKTLLDPNASLKQRFGAAKVLRSDMENRHHSYDATLGQIRDRMGVLPATTPTPAPPANRKPLSEIFTK